MSSRHRADDEAVPTCGCGHLRTAHRHYRRGTDCASCACPAFRRRAVHGFPESWRPRPVSRRRGRRPGRHAAPEGAAK